MKEYFQHQLKLEETKPIDEEMLSKLKGEGYFGEYAVGDVILGFFEEVDYTPNSSGIVYHNIIEDHLELLDDYFEFIEMKGMFPVFKLRKSEDDGERED